MPQFSHLHCHTQYSILDGAANIGQMVKKAAADGMPAVAITDHGNMFGVYEFVNTCNKEKVKPIVGCEFYLVQDMSIRSFAGAGIRDRRYHQLLLAKNPEGYQNLTRLTSMAYKDGLYGKFPRIDMELLKKNKNGLIATTCCIGGIVPQTILEKGVEAGEVVFKEWLDLFGEDYYVELQRHNLTNINGTTWSQEGLNQVLLNWSEKYNVPAIATNDSHYVDQEDSEMHDILLCINTGAKKSQPKKSDDEDGTNKDTRFGFANDQFFFKTSSEMEKLFHDVPQALENTQIIVDKIELLDLKKEIMMPNFVVPTGFDKQSDYMRHLVYEGAKKRYKEITSEISERIELELNTIFTAKYEGYFLVIEDFLTVARKLDVSVGPGRGSAAGSVVAYCLGITNVDPITYGLLFERFLNPERVSFPDIDIDFEDAGRQKVLDYVVKKYGENSVAQIVTYGTMKEKSAIRDVARVLELPLMETGVLAKTVPDLDLKKVLDDKEYETLKKGMRENDRIKADKFREFYKTPGLYKTVIDNAIKLKGSVRNVGVHACGVIIAPDDLKNHVPLSMAKDSTMIVTQYDKDIVESVGLLKMDFLGLKTLSVIKDIISIIEKKHKVKIDIDEISLDDQLAYKVFQEGMTDGIFQFESDGMKANLRGLKPDRFTDLIAMNALYRPGPMDYIPNYIKRKHGEEEVSYDIDITKEILQETYGIMVYQEQVMLLSQLLANFTKGEADTLRKAMGKKNKEVMDKLHPKYIEGCIANGHDQTKAQKIWTDMEKFAEYAFNKSHSTCYALIAYQTSYLKAHYPQEFMAGLMSNNMSNTDDVKKYIEVCKRMNIDVLGPDVNESDYIFMVNDKKQIRFGLSAIKGVGENVIIEMVAERESNGKFLDIYDFVVRLGSKYANKKVLEALAISGAFDCFDEIRRDQYFGITDQSTFIEHLIRYSNNLKKTDLNQQSNLFGEAFQDMVEKPSVPLTAEFTLLERLEKEKEVLGIYMSGHPLDKYKKVIRDTTITIFEEIKLSRGEEWIVGLVKDIQEDTEKTYLRFKLLGLDDAISLNLKKERLEKYSKYIEDGKIIMVQLKWSSFESKKDNKVIEFFDIKNILPEPSIYTSIRKLILSLDMPNFQSEMLGKMVYVIEKYKGTTPVYLSIETPMITPPLSAQIVNTVDSKMLDDRDGDVELDVSDEAELETLDGIQAEKMGPMVNALEIKSTTYSVKICEELLNELSAILTEDKVTVLI
jgi:DNA polymerase III subunit alpha